VGGVGWGGGKIKRKRSRKVYLQQKEDFGSCVSSVTAKFFVFEVNISVSWPSGSCSISLCTLWKIAVPY